MKIGNRSTFLQGSFRKYQWREALLLCLARLTEGFIHQPTEVIMEQMRQMTDVKEETQAPEMSPQDFLRLMSDENAVPFALTPHSIFFLCSEQNFIAACFDWIFSSLSERSKLRVSMACSRLG